MFIIVRMTMFFCSANMVYFLFCKNLVNVRNDYLGVTDKSNVVIDNEMAFGTVT